MKRGVAIAVLAGVLMGSSPSLFFYGQLNAAQVFHTSFLENILGNYSQAPYTVEKYKVLSVVDGDTIDVDVNGYSQRVRFTGIDTPERWAPYFEDASRRTRSLIFDQGHGEVTLVRYLNEENEDDHNRWLRYPFIVNEQEIINVGERLIEESLASAYCYRDNVKHFTDTFAHAQARALINGHIGIWHDYDNPENYNVNRLNRWKVKMYIGRLRKGIESSAALMKADSEFQRSVNF